MNYSFNLKKRKASHKDYSFHKSKKLGSVLLPSDFIIPSQILSQTQEDCTAYSEVGARMSEIPNSSFDPNVFWNDELAFAAMKTSTGFNVEVPSAVAIKTGFCPTGNPSLRQNNYSDYLWIHPHDGMDLFDATRTAIYTTKYVAKGGLDWYDEWSSGNGTISERGKNLLGGHRVRLAGWRTKDGVVQMAIPNTWGTGVGENGWFYMTREIFNKAFPPYGVLIGDDSQDFTVKTLGYFNALLVNLKTLLRK